MKRISSRILTIVILIVVILVALYTLFFVDGPVEQDLSEYSWDSTVDDNLLEFNGQKYILNNKVTATLIAGVDKEGKVSYTYDGTQNGGQADMLLLMVVNDADKTVDFLQIDRDTMATFNTLNSAYLKDGIINSQIAVSHSYGNGGTVSCQNTVSAVENLLYNINIKEYYFVNIDAIPIINDFFGGVTVDIEDDFSSVNPSLEMDTTITLQGEQARDYLVSRKQLPDGTNQNRSKRHKVYMKSLIDNIVSSVETENTDMITEFDNEVHDYVVTTLSANDMLTLATKVSKYKRNDFINLEGEFTMDTDLMQFIVDEEAAKELVVDLFYIPYEK